jgi:hypothetical protein
VGRGNRSNAGARYRRELTGILSNATQAAVQVSAMIALERALRTRDREQSELDEILDRVLAE